MPCALLVAPAGHGAETEEALRALGTPAEPSIAPELLNDQLARQALVDILAVDATSLDDRTLDMLLPQLREVSARGSTRVVVAFGEDQIDRIGGALIGTSATLLCDPTMAERVAALAIRPKVYSRAHDREGERTPAEIVRLSAEVERIARALARLTGVDEPNQQGTDQKPAFAPPPAPGAEEIDVGTVRAAIRARRLREQFFERDLLGEPGWDILLDLFAAELEQLRVSVSSLCIAAAVPPTTALRWITGMTEAGLLERQADAADRRRAFVRLTATASTGMRNYFAALRRLGLAAG